LIVGYGRTWWAPRFIWFRPPERNILRPWENEVVLLKPGLARVSLTLSSGRESIFDPREEVSTWSFYSLILGSYNETRGLTDGPKVVKTLYNI
jgi:hypothetical protein